MPESSITTDATNGAIVKPVKRVRINPEASVVLLDSIPDPGVRERSASVSASSPKAGERVATAEPSHKIDEVVDPTDMDDGTDHDTNSLLQKFMPLELYEQFRACMKVCVSSSPRAPSYCLQWVGA